MSKIYHYVTSLQFEAESEDEAYQKLYNLLASGDMDGDVLRDMDNWALDPEDADNFDEMKHTFPAGRYYIGDPCYVVANDDWSALCDFTGVFGCSESPNYNDGIFTYKGKQCFSAGTAWGDGSYRDNRGHNYGVDAGMIGIIPEEVCTFGQNLYDDTENVFEFKREFEVWMEDGVFHFGTIRIDTN